MPIADLATRVLCHILQALDCLAAQGIIHRDVKPENILHTSRQGQYHFQLGDFGLSNRQIIATTYSGTPLYMAPEMFQNGEQTHKVDVWSLVVTIMWTLDAQGFREAANSFKSYEDAQSKVLLTTRTPQMASIEEMARINPKERASAAQMLIKCFSGEGLVTPRHRVPPLAPVSSTPEKAGRRTRAAAGPAAGPQSIPAQPEPKRKNAKPVPAAGQFRVEKARRPLARPGQPIGLGPDKHPNPSLHPKTSEKGRIPGGFPGDEMDTSSF